jgi:hypothetical protein
MTMLAITSIMNDLLYLSRFLLFSYSILGFFLLNKIKYFWYLRFIDGSIFLL